MTKDQEIEMLKKKLSDIAREMFAISFQLEALSEDIMRSQEEA